MNPTKTILVVDDDAVLRAGLQTMLQHHGYQTVEAEDGLDAQLMIDAKRPDLVILDMMMPRWGGYAVLEHFQNKAGAPPFIMLTAHDGAKHQAYAKQIGAVDYFVKPVAFERLIARIDNLFKESRSEAAVSSEEAFLRVICGNCDATIKAPVQMLGMQRPCPRCKRPLVIKRGPPSDEGPQVMLEM